MELLLRPEQGLLGDIVEESSPHTRRDGGYRFCVATFSGSLANQQSDNNVDDYINTHELAAIEVYPSGAWVPLQFATSIAAMCGTIVLWTADALTH